LACGRALKINRERPLVLKGCSDSSDAPERILFKSLLEKSVKKIEPNGRIRAGWLTKSLVQT
jgi:hypothetical protein